MSYTASYRCCTVRVVLGKLDMVLYHCHCTPLLCWSKFLLPHARLHPNDCLQLIKSSRLVSSHKTLSKTGTFYWVNSGAIVVKWPFLLPPMAHMELEPLTYCLEVSQTHSNRWTMAASYLHSVSWWSIIIIFCIHFVGATSPYTCKSVYDAVAWRTAITPHECRVHMDLNRCTCMYMHKLSSMYVPMKTDNVSILTQMSCQVCPTCNLEWNLMQNFSSTTSCKTQSSKKYYNTSTYPIMLAKHIYFYDILRWWIN